MRELKSLLMIWRVESIVTVPPMEVLIIRTTIIITKFKIKMMDQVINLHQS